MIKIAKNKTIFVCNEGGYESAKWLGKCPACNEWNTLVEEKVIGNLKTNETKKEKAIPTKLNSVEKQEITRITTTFSELDRVLGGGFVKGSLTLLGGEPGIRKININITNLR